MPARSSDHRLSCGTAALLGLTLGLCSACSDRSSSSEDPSPGALRGKLQVIQVEGYGPDAGAKYFFQVNGSDRLLKLSFDRPPEWISGTPLRLYGYQQGELFRVTDYEVEGRLLGLVGLVALGLRRRRSRRPSDRGCGPNPVRAATDRPAPANR